jgi:signal transduction histidine kinase
MIMMPAPRDPEVAFRNEPVIAALLIEDDVYYGKLIQRTLRTPSPQFSVKWVTTLTEAMELLSIGTYDVVISDLELPDATGLEALHSVREMDAQIPIVILTAHNEASVGLEAIKSGADDFIIKERVSADSLVRSVRYAVERKKCEELTARIEAIKDFTGMLAHDLRAPLVGASRVFECLDDASVADDDKTELVRHLRESNNRLLNLVTQLIEVYRLEMAPPAVHVRAIPLVPSLECSIEAVSALLQVKHLEVQRDIDPVLPPVECDRVGLERVLTNLLDNACKFAPNGSTVTVRAKYLQETGAVRIDVTDRGNGVSLDARHMLFKRIWHASPGKAYSATGGLGLYLCDKIVTAYGGAIWFDSDAEHTTFTVALRAQPLSQSV